MAGRHDAILFVSLNRLTASARIPFPKSQPAFYVKLARCLDSFSRIEPFRKRNACFLSTHLPPTFEAAKSHHQLCREEEPPASGEGGAVRSPEPAAPQIDLE